MSLRDDAEREHPGFPWLDPQDPAGVAAFLEAGDWLESGEHFVGCESAGEGNMNLTLRIRTDRRRFILKQARPWVEKYDTIPAPWDRSLLEHRFYRKVRDLRGVAGRMPRLLGGDPEARVLLLEDLPGARDLSTLYAGIRTDAAPLSDGVLRDLAVFLRTLHSQTEVASGELPRTEFANREMRALNHAHIFVIPLAKDNGLELDSFESGLAEAALELRDDPRYRAGVADLGELYLRDGRCLLHGDYFPGSWLESDLGLRIIDPEFAFYGDPEWDLGCALAHLALAAQPHRSARFWLDCYAKEPGAPRFDPTLVARYAGVEVMRRLIGVAQLPMPRTERFRRDLLERSRRTLNGSMLETLFAGGRVE